MEREESKAHLSQKSPVNVSILQWTVEVKAAGKILRALASIGILQSLIGMTCYRIIKSLKVGTEKCLSHANIILDILVFFLVDKQSPILSNLSFIIQL